MENNVTTFSAGMKYGLFSAIGLIIFDMLLYLTGLKDPEGSAIQYLGLLILLGGVILGIKYYRDNNESLSYGQGVGVGTLVGLFAGIITAIYIIIFFNFIDPAFLEEIRNAAFAKMEENPNMTDAQLETSRGMMETFTSPTFMGISSVVLYTIVGLIVSLIGSAVLKNNTGA